MESKDFFTKMEANLKNKLPFVIYRKPTSTGETIFSLQGFFQQDDHLYTVNDFKESGFVMAPFNLDKEKPLLIPSEKSEQISARFDAPAPLEPSTVQQEIDQNAKKRHLDLVTKGIEALRKGELNKVVLSRTLHAKTDHKPTIIFKRLLHAYPTAFVYCWFHPKKGLWLGATPEGLLKSQGYNIKTVALAGTKPAFNDENPQWTTKEIQEQQYVTDFIKERLAKNTKQVSVSKTENVRAGNLWHLKTGISARLLQKENLKDILHDIHPTPAVCGVPKAKSKQFILKEESYNRMFYSGFLGELNLKRKNIRKANRRNIEHQAYAGFQESSEFFVNLRCMQMQDSTCTLYIGGGIMKESDPEDEWQETVNKATTVLKAL